ncbi:odorant receptor 3 [Anopheles sinensis]|uniref:Odorant receptor 3 n=1 Tax=Anopheles sinensis TaxID=74873 RepID=A0A084VEK6_ANOSI|nr:odorant receptor 3 [Anopheles sinensis]
MAEKRESPNRKLFSSQARYHQRIMERAGNKIGMWPIATGPGHKLAICASTGALVGKSERARPKVLN